MSRIITEARDGWGLYVETNHPLVGQEVTRKFKIRVDGTDYTEADAGFSYQWYRRNPKNYAMTKISGATSKTYTPTMEDVGYELIGEVHGEGNSSFYFCNRGSEVVHMPVHVSLSYAGEDGFVMNSEYELPKPLGENLKYIRYSWEGDDETGHSVETEMTLADVNIVERQSGQYAFYWPVQLMDGSYLQSLNNGYTVGDLPISLVSEATGSNYSGEYTDDNPYVTIFNSSVIYNCLASFYVYPTFNGERLNATVDVIGPNMDSELVLKTSKTLKPEYQISYVYLSTNISNPDENICLLYMQNGYYVRVKATEATADTYYNSTLLWSEATPIDLSGKSPKVTVETKPAFAALEGPGSITGSVNTTSEASARGNRAPEVTESYTVFLRKNGSEIIAETQTDANGVYRFDNVPLGTYQVLVNIDGYTQEQPATVTLTAENPTATDVDYKISGTEIISTSICDIRSMASQSHVFYTIDGRRVSQPTQRGIYISGAKKIVVK